MRRRNHEVHQVYWPAFADIRASIDADRELNASPMVKRLVARPRRYVEEGRSQRSAEIRLVLVAQLSNELRRDIEAKWGRKDWDSLKKDRADLQKKCESK